MAKKFSVSLSPLTLDQLKWLEKNVFFNLPGLSLSALIRLAILYAYEKAPR